jgi:hypothetical protein
VLRAFTILRTVMRGATGIASARPVRHDLARLKRCAVRPSSGQVVAVLDDPHRRAHVDRKPHLYNVWAFHLRRMRHIYDPQ